jgi:hypothetical protein
VLRRGASAAALGLGTTVIASGSVDAATYCPRPASHWAETDWPHAETALANVNDHVPGQEFDTIPEWQTFLRERPEGAASRTDPATDPRTDAVADPQTDAVADPRTDAVVESRVDAAFDLFGFLLEPEFTVESPPDVGHEVAAHLVATIVNFQGVPGRHCIDVGFQDVDDDGQEESVREVKAMTMEWLKASRFPEQQWSWFVPDAPVTDGQRLVEVLVDFNRAAFDLPFCPCPDS